MVWDMLQRPPSETQLWRALRNGHAPQPSDVAARILRALNRYERKWPKDGQEMLQLGWVISELDYLLLPRNQPPSAEQIYWGWKRIEKAAYKITGFSQSIDFHLTRWAEGLVYKAAQRAADAKQSVAHTRHCVFCWLTAKRTVSGWPCCTHHLPSKPGGRKMRYLAKRMGGGNLKRGIEKYQAALVIRQQRIFHKGGKTIKNFTLAKARRLDPASNPWWKTGEGVLSLFGPEFVYIRYSATKLLLESLRRAGLRRKRVSGMRGGRPKTWTKRELRKAMYMRRSGKSLREIKEVTGVSRSTIYRLHV